MPRFHDPESRSSFLGTWPTSACVLTRWEFTLLDEGFTSGDSIQGVDRKDFDGGPADGGESVEHRPRPNKMLTPAVKAGMVEPGQLSCAGIKPGDIRPLVSVAEDANRLRLKSSLVDPPNHSR